MKPTELNLIVLGGMLVMTGLALAVAALRPAAPRLGAVLDQLNAKGGPLTAPGMVASPWWSPDWLTSLALRRLGAAEEDLEILGLSREDLAARKVGYLLAGVLTPPLGNAFLMGAGMSLPWLFPAIVSLAAGAAAWLAPSREVAERAARARVEFREALRVFLMLVGLERKVRGSPIEALEEASRESAFWPFKMIHAEVLKAEKTNQLPWNALRDLGERLRIEQLVNMANIVGSADDGAAIFDTLLAESRNLENAQMEERRKAAGLAAEKLTFPAILFALGFLALLAYPAFSRF